MKIHNIIKTNVMCKYRKSLSITLASLLLASSFPVNGGTSLAKSVPATMVAAAGSNLSLPTPASRLFALPFPFNGALSASASAFPTMAAAAGSDFTYVIRTCQRFGNDNPNGGCFFRGERLDLTFNLPSNLVPGTAHVMFQTSGVGNSCNRFEINGTQIGLPNRGDLAQSVAEFGDIPSGVLKPGENTLLIRSVNSGCTFGGDLDEFTFNNLVFFYHVQ